MRSVVVFLLTMLCAEFAVANQIEPVRPDGQHAVTRLGKNLQFLVDETAALDLAGARRAYADGHFQRGTGDHFDPGYTRKVHWVTFEIDTTALAEFAVTLSTNRANIPTISIYVVRKDGSVEMTLSKTAQSPFNWLDYFGMSVVARQFLVKPGQPARIFIRYQPEGFGVLPLSIEMPMTLFFKTHQAAIGFSIFYTYALTALIFFIVSIAALGGQGGGYFIGLFIASLLVLVQIDGFPNAYLWPNWPRWNQFVIVPLIFIANAAVLLTAGFMLRDGAYARYEPLCRIVAAAMILPVLLGIAIGAFWVLPLGYLLLAANAPLLIFAGIQWARNVGRQTLIAGAASFAMLLFVVIGIASALSGTLGFGSVGPIVLKGLYGVFSITIMVAFATHARALTLNFQEAQAREIEAIRRDAELNRALLESERNYSRARDLAKLRQRQLAEASHDLRQPIASLRLTMDAFAGDADQSVRRNLDNAFDYLERLVAGNLEATRPGTEDPDLAQLAEPLAADQLDDPVDAEDAPEVLPLSVVLDAVTAMFTEEAISKGIALRCVPSTVSVQAEPMVLMRIISNLVSNAVQYTDRGKVVMGAKRCGDHVRIVVADTGPGMTAAQLASFQRAYNKGSASKGEGLGLAICFELAAENGMALEVTSQEGRGACFRLTLERAA